jgi:hypothetical protein
MNKLTKRENTNLKQIFTFLLQFYELNLFYLLFLFIFFKIVTMAIKYCNGFKSLNFEPIMF